MIVPGISSQPAEPTVEKEAVNHRSDEYCDAYRSDDYQPCVECVFVAGFHILIFLLIQTALYLKQLSVSHGSLPLKWIAYGEVECKRVFKGGHVVVAFFAGVVGEVYANAEVAAYNQHADVNAESGSRTGGKVAQK